MVAKQNKRAAKRKARLDNLFAPIRAPASGFTAFLLFFAALVSCPTSPAPLSSRLRSLTYLSHLFTCLGTSTALLSRLIPAWLFGSLAVLLPLFVLDQTPLHLAYTAFRTFKLALSNEPLRRSTFPVEFFCPFLPLDSLSIKTDHKQAFAITFINSGSLAGNYV